AGINTASFIKLVKTYGWVLISFIAGAFFQYCSILYLKSIGIIQRGNFRTETVALSDFPQRVFEISKTSLIKLYSYIGNADISYINFLFFILLIFLIFNVLLKAVFSNASFLQKILRPFIFILLLAAAFILSNSSAMLEYELTIRRLFEDSLNVFGLTYFHVLIVVLLLRQVTAEERDLRWKNFVKNATVFLSILILYNCAIYNAKIQKTFKLKFEAETKLWNRVIDRIEQVDGFDSGEKYALLTIGRFRSITPYMPDAENNNYLMRRSLDADWASLEGPLTYTNDFTSFRYTSISGRKDITRFYNDADIKALLKMSSEIEKAKPYPDKTSIVIKDGILMVILDQEGLDKARALIQEHRKAQEK
ncbi:MAG: hypothetical protein LBH29_07655, partial [Elusimicrobiota bacterium]|nr:hypothetical protein [Elusimicrobiota bacterium]